MEKTDNKNWTDWTVCLSAIEDNTVVPSKDAPEESGDYICTCVLKSFKTVYKFIAIMHWDNELKYWHDPLHEHQCSNVVLAWMPLPEVCEFDDFKYFCGRLVPKD